MNAIIHDIGATVEILDDFTPELADGGQGFDRGKMRIAYKSTSPGIPASYAKGGTISGYPNMYCLGPIAFEKSKWGRTWATIGYKGFAGAAAATDIKAFSSQLAEQMFPTYAGAQPIYYNGKLPIGTGTINPKTNKYWRVRALREEGQLTVTGWEIIVGGTTALSGGTTPPDASGIPARFRTYDSAANNFTDPLVTVIDGAAAGAGLGQNGGLALASYNSLSIEQLGNVKLHNYQAVWKFYPTYSA